MKNLSIIIMILYLMLGLCRVSNAEDKNTTKRGELLYATNCSVCHTSKTNWREQKLVTDWSSLLAQVNRWQFNGGLGWNDEETKDVAVYLNALLYGYKGDARNQKKL